MTINLKDKPTVVQSNDLTESIYNLDVIEMRLIAYSCSKIHSEFDQAERIRIPVIEFARVFQLPTETIHKALSKGVKSLASKYVVIPNDKDPKMDRVIPWLSEGEYEKKPNGENSEVYLTFNPKMQPFLYHLGKYYTVVDFEHLAELKTPFSNRLYQWLCKNRYLMESRKKGVFTVDLKVDWMKKRAAIPDSYVWKDFWKRHLKPAIEKINALNDFYITFETVKKGRSVESVLFTCSEESTATIKPIRPRLAKRPKANKGGHDEGVWARKNIKLLTDYRNELKAYDKTLSLTLPDLRRLHEYHTIIGDTHKAELYKAEIDARTPASNPKKERLKYIEEGARIIFKLKEAGIIDEKITSKEAFEITSMILRKTARK